jgi:hypothetical protein
VPAGQVALERHFPDRVNRPPSPVRGADFVRERQLSATGRRFGRNRQRARARIEREKSHEPRPLRIVTPFRADATPFFSSAGWHRLCEVAGPRTERMRCRRCPRPLRLQGRRRPGRGPEVRTTRVLALWLPRCPTCHRDCDCQNRTGLPAPRRPAGGRTVTIAA